MMPDNSATKISPPKLAASSHGTSPAPTNRPNRQRNERRNGQRDRAKSTGPHYSKPVTPAWDNEPSGAGKKQGTFASDGTFIADTSARTANPRPGQPISFPNVPPPSTRSRSHTNNRRVSRRHRSQSRSGASHPPEREPAGANSTSGAASAGASGSSSGASGAIPPPPPMPTHFKHRSNGLPPLSGSTTPKKMPLGYFTADGRFVDDDAIEDGAHSDSVMGTSGVRRHKPKQKSMSHAYGIGNTPSAKKPFPFRGATTTPGKEAAYAGPTFHASPDPSLLPIPRFFSASKAQGFSRFDSDSESEFSAPSTGSPPGLTSPPATPTPKIPHAYQEKSTDSPLNVLFASQRKAIEAIDKLSISGRNSPTPAAGTPKSIVSQDKIQPNLHKKEFLTHLMVSVHQPGSSHSSPPVPSLPNSTSRPLENAFVGPQPPHGHGFPHMSHYAPHGGYPSMSIPPRQFALDDQPSPFISHPITNGPPPNVAFYNNYATGFGYGGQR